MNGQLTLEITFLLTQKDKYLQLASFGGRTTCELNVCESKLGHEFREINSHDNQSKYSTVHITHLLLVEAVQLST